MRRRHVLAIFTAAMAAAPGAVFAQRTEQTPRVGVLMRLAADDRDARPIVQAFQQGLQALGWTIGSNLQVDYRWAASASDRGEALAKELLGLKPDVVVAHGTPMLEALRQQTHTIPIVFAVVSDPVGQGFVESLKRPGGNTTGFTSLEFPIGGKWLELLKEIAPGVVRVSVIFNPLTAPYASPYVHPIQSAAATLAVEARSVPVQDDAEIERVMAALGQKPGGGLIILPDSFTDVHRGSIIALAAQHRLPAVYPYLSLSVFRHRRWPALLWA